MFDVPSGVRFDTMATTRASSLGSLRAGTVKRTRAQRASLSDVERRMGVDGVNAGSTGRGTVTPSIDSKPSLPDEGEAAAEGDPPVEDECQVKAATSTDATTSPAPRRRLSRNAMSTTR